MESSDFEDIVRQELLQDDVLPAPIKCMILERARGMNVVQTLRTLAERKMTGTGPQALAF